MQCVEELSPEALFDLDEIEAVPAFDTPAFTFTEAETSSATTCTVSVTLVAENPYDGFLCYAQSPLGLLAIEEAIYAMGGAQRVQTPNPAQAAQLQSAQQIIGSLGVGVAKGAGGALVVGGTAVGATAIGVPVAAVTATLGGVAIVGAGLFGWDVGQSIQHKDWPRLANAIGAATGGAIVGLAGGRAFAEGINGKPSPQWSLSRDWAQGYDPSLGSIWTWLGTGPNPGSAGLGMAMSGAGLGVVDNNCE